MAEVRWVFVERCQGAMRRITALDDDLGIVTTHERDLAGPELEADEFQLLRAAELGGRTPIRAAPSRRRATID
jgi:hypothetical protein